MGNRRDPREMLITTVKTARMLQMTSKALRNGAVVAMVAVNVNTTPRRYRPWTELCLQRGNH
jgi:hypothetical protein